MAPSDNNNRSAYSRANKLVKKSCRKDDENWALRVATAAVHGWQREVWQQIKTLAGKKSRKSTAVKDKSGKLIADPSAQRERWGEHFSELLNPPPTNADKSDLDHLEVVPCFPYLGDGDGPPTRLEILNCLKKLKNQKSAWVDEISNEQL